jgi:hypothetical protein
MEAGLQKISNSVSSTRRAGGLAMEYQMVWPSRRARTKPSRRSSDKCCDTVESRRPRKLREIAHRPLALGQLAEDQQPMAIAERAQQLACLLGCRSHVVWVDLHRRTFTLAYLR